MNIKLHKLGKKFTSLFFRIKLQSKIEKILGKKIRTWEIVTCLPILFKYKKDIIFLTLTLFASFMQ